jgi:hypothetical protein
MARTTRRVTAGEATDPETADRYVLPLVHVAVPATLVHFGSSRAQASRDHYVVPLAHLTVPAQWVDYGLWGALGLAVAAEGVSALLRRRSRPPRT